MYGLYDIDGILRFTCSDPEACMAYADLLEIASDEYSLVNLPETKQLNIKTKSEKDRLHREASSN